MSTHNLCFEQLYEKYQNFYLKNFKFLEVKFSIYLNRRVFVMHWQFRPRSSAAKTQRLIRVRAVCIKRKIFFFFFFLIWALRPFQEYFTYIEPIVHQRRAKTGELGGKNTWPFVSRTLLSHMWPERGSNHSGEKPNGFRVSSLIH